MTDLREFPDVGTLTQGLYKAYTGALRHEENYVLAWNFLRIALKIPALYRVVYVSRVTPNKDPNELSLYGDSEKRYPLFWDATTSLVSGLGFGQHGLSTLSNDKTFAANRLDKSLP